MNLDVYFAGMQKTVDKSINNIKEVLAKGDEFSQFIEHLLTTGRNPYEITDQGYDIKDAIAFDSFIGRLKHALYDDGDITFFTSEHDTDKVLEYLDNLKPKKKKRKRKERNKTVIDFTDSIPQPKFTFREPNPKEIESILMEPFASNPMMAYKVNILETNLTNWIKLSKEYESHDLRRCFLFDTDMYGLDFSIPHYSENKLFDHKWIDIAKEKYVNNSSNEE